MQASHIFVQADPGLQQSSLVFVWPSKIAHHMAHYSDHVEYEIIRYPSLLAHPVSTSLLASMS